MSTSNDAVEISGEVEHETSMAVLFYDGNIEVWLPKSQILAQTETSIEIPEWLALDKGLI